MIDTKLLQWATPSEAEMLEAVNLHGSYRKAATALNSHHSTISRSMDRLTLRAATQGYSPEHDLQHTVPAPFIVNRVTTQYGGDGTVERQWVKSKIDVDQRWQAILETIENRCAAIRPKPLIHLQGGFARNADLCNLVTLTDCHVGALAWDREAGEDWDLKIAQETLTRCFIGMIRSMPSAGTCIISQLGDFLHTDGLVPTTPAHGHILDADGRFQKMSEVATEILEDVIVAALECHDKVHVIMAEGNHDESSSVWLRVMFKRLFRDNPRLTVEDSPLPYYAYQHGNVMLSFHHGHKLRPASLPMWFATKFSEMWGATKARYGHSGHQHHLHEKDEMGMRWLQHPTLAASDAYSARGGWISPREAVGITYDLDGEASRIFIRPKMFRDMEV
jgi:hypothetical protein